MSGRAGGLAEVDRHNEVFLGVRHHICHWEGVMTDNQTGIKVMGGEMTIPVFPVMCTCS